MPRSSRGLRTPRPSDGQTPNRIAGLPFFYGWVVIWAAALGPLPLALARDQLGSYGPGLACFGALAVLGAFAALACRPPLQRGAAVPRLERAEAR